VDWYDLHMVRQTPFEPFSGVIIQVLQQVYLDHDRVDDELVESIRYPSDHPNAAEVSSVQTLFTR